jgi:hypothetical protein
MSEARSNSSREMSTEQRVHAQVHQTVLKGRRRDKEDDNGAEGAGGIMIRRFGDSEYCCHTYHTHLVPKAKDLFGSS